MRKVQIILAGVGGQGILFASKLFSELGLRLGLNILGAETHGMSQRGGSVVAHLKLGDFQSPLIRSGAADVLYSFEKNETWRNLKFLKKGGVCYVNIPCEDRFDEKALKYLKDKEITLKEFDASKAALTMGSIMTANIVLIGYSLGTGLVPFHSGDLRDVLERISQKRYLEMNLKAFEVGFCEGKGG